jgi:hypothetical protein
VVVVVVCEPSRLTRENMSAAIASSRLLRSRRARDVFLILPARHDRRGIADEPLSLLID